MDHPPIWNPLTEWKHVDIDWIRVDIQPEDLKRFMRRSDWKGLAQSLGFLATVAATGTLAYLAFLNERWILMALALYAHGGIYGFFSPALHELSHFTVFKSKWLSRLMIYVYGWFFWPYNPFLYRASHFFFHHRYTLYQGSDGEDAPGYFVMTPKDIFFAFTKVFRFQNLGRSLYRLFTLKPTSVGWRNRTMKLDPWEIFILQRSSEKDRRRIRRFAVFSLASHVAFAAICLATGHWFLIVLITLAPFYGPTILGLLCGPHQHACCEANCPDFKKSCGSATLDPILSFLYWRMENHTEHHMYPAMPCYNLRAFSRFVADQMPPREWTIPRLFKLNRRSKEMYGSYQNWRDHYGRFKGL
jgi:fatty acid desaturase